ncbi:PRLHR [Mytilus coruscus]|uniref:PRLHR n=1 Tax=Mytilus coruscus TaxID=42192 RepID=A0A6J8DLT2_MYTCO|nr:PRLHR [Mytilus coruscus]
MTVAIEKIIAYIFGTTIILFNLLFSAIGIKTFSKKIHSLLVLLLGVSEGIHGIAVICITYNSSDEVIPKEYTLHINYPVCTLQLLAYFVSIGFSLTLLLLISIERYVTVKNFNFVSTRLSLKKKYVAIVILMGLIWTYICVFITTAPVKKIKECSVGTIYHNDNIDINGWAIICLYVSLIVANLVLYGKTTSNLWKIFYKASVLSQKKAKKSVPDAPVPVSRQDQTLSDADIPSTSKDPIHNPSFVATRKSSLWNVAKNKVMQSRSSFRLTGIQGKPYTSRKTIQFEDGFNLDNTVVSDKRRRKVSTVILNPWERRAMFTNFYLIVAQIVFFLPFISLLVAELLEANIPQDAWSFGTLWLMVHFLINPFIFAWRIKEVHSEMRKFFRCSTQVEPSIAGFSLQKRKSLK